MIMTSSPGIYLPQNLGSNWYYDSMSVTGNGTVLTDFAAVQNMSDLSGNGHNLSQSNASIAPLYRTMTLANSNTLSVSGTKYMTASNISYAGEISIVALVECDVSFVSSAGFFVSYGSDGGVAIGNGLSNFGKLRFVCNGVGGFETVSSSIFVNGQFCVVGCILKNNAGTWTVDVYKNGAFVETVSAAQPVASSANFALSALNSSGSNGWLGQIVALAGWHRVLSSWELNMMNLYFRIRGQLSS